ncbi:ankyrin repeat protein [Elusimicrobium posterum]|uniref:ankyrin repeat domain-containing protein n=1 Tax=Elusimicrobium posterum TaxID=3116653 RepID=UPI003C71FA71
MKIKYLVLFFICAAGLLTAGLFLSSNLDEDAHLKCDENTPLSLAIKENNLQSAALLAEGKNLTKYNDCGHLPLQTAVLFQNFNIVKLLVEAGADVNAVNKHDKETALITAAGLQTGNNAHITQYLISQGADVNARDDFNMTALHKAACNHYEGKVKALLQNNADVNIKDNNGKTALHFALSCGIEEQTPNVIQMLIAKGANVNAKDNLAMTPLMYASINTHDNIPLDALRTLIKNGADINAKNNAGESALNPFIADTTQDRRKVTTYLKRSGAKD